MELPIEIYEKIKKICRTGDILVMKNDCDEAIIKYKEALNLLPDPKLSWEASTWIYTAIGDAFFIKKQFSAAIGYFSMALKTPDGLENAFVLLRLGQCYFEIDEKGNAREHLLKAYIFGEQEIFQDEEKKYLEVIKNII